MRLESREPTNESEFYQSLRGRVGADIYFERVEPSNESGFPDVHFVLRDHIHSIWKPNEGTIELKFDTRREPNLKTLLRGTQQSALLEYYEAGGRRRFALCYCSGHIFIWDTEAFRRAILGEKESWTAERRWNVKDEEAWKLTDWLTSTFWKD